MPKTKPPGKTRKHEPKHSPANHYKNPMNKVKIKRVKRNKKKITTQEKVVAGLGVGATLLGGAGAVVPKTQDTQFVSTQSQEQTARTSKIKDTLNKIFGGIYQNTIGPKQAKAEEMLAASGDAGASDQGASGGGDGGGDGGGVTTDPNTVTVSTTPTNAWYVSDGSAVTVYLGSDGNYYASSDPNSQILDVTTTDPSTGTSKSNLANFPSNPSNGDTYTDPSGTVWTYNASTDTWNDPLQTTTAPTITLNGDSVMNLTVGQYFTDPDATISDGSTPLVSGVVPAGSPAGTYIITYTDPNDSTVSTSRTVNVTDPTQDASYTIKLNTGNDTVQQGGTWADAGANVYDENDNEISSDITGSGNVNTSQPGTYTVTYSFTNASPVTRTVTVTAPAAPTITLNGDSVMNLTVGQYFTDPDATISDGSTPLVSGVVPAGSPAGTYIITYTDPNDSTVSTSRTVNVTDPTQDASYTIKLNTGNDTVQQGGTWADAGANVYDENDNEISSDITGSGNVNTSQPGTYTVTYSFTNASPVTRTVTVTAPAAPTITLNGDSVMNLTVGQYFTDPDATISDGSTPLVSGVVPAGSPAGTYIITYTDPNDSTVSTSRTVNVTDPTQDASYTIKLNTGNDTVQQGGTWADAGANVYDENDNEISSDITGSGNVNTSQPGTYTVTYSFTNASPVTRTVTVTAPAAPTITLNGDSVMNLTVGQYFTDPDATISDGSTPLVSGVVPAGSPAGTYIITYTDPNDSTVSTSRTVNVTAATSTTFPTNPANGATYTDSSGNTWTYNASSNSWDEPLLYANLTPAGTLSDGTPYYNVPVGGSPYSTASGQPVTVGASGIGSITTAYPTVTLSSSVTQVSGGGLSATINVNNTPQILTVTSTGRILDSSGADITNQFSAAQVAAIQSALTAGSVTDNTPYTVFPSTVNNTAGVLAYVGTDANGNAINGDVTVVQNANGTYSGYVNGTLNPNISQATLSAIASIGQSQKLTVGTVGSATGSGSSGTIGTAPSLPATLPAGVTTQITQNSNGSVTVTVVDANGNSVAGIPPITASNLASLSSQLQAYNAGTVTPVSQAVFQLFVQAYNQLGAANNSLASSGAQATPTVVNGTSGSNVSFSTDSGNNSNLSVGNNWTITITAPAGTKDGTPVFATSIQNGVQTTTQMGTIEGGKLVLAGTVGDQQVGNWSEQFTIGAASGSSAVSAGTLNFSVTPQLGQSATSPAAPSLTGSEGVVPTGTPVTGSTATMSTFGTSSNTIGVGNNWVINVTGATPNAPVYGINQNGTIYLGITDANGNLQTMGPILTNNDVGTWSVSIMVGSSLAANATPPSNPSISSLKQVGNTLNFTVSPATVPFTPTFITNAAVVYLPTGQSQALNPANYATQATAEWLAQQFGGTAVLVPITTYTAASPFQANAAGASQWMIQFPDGTQMNAGNLAQWFVTSPANVATGFVQSEIAAAQYYHDNPNAQPGSFVSTTNYIGKPSSTATTNPVALNGSTAATTGSGTGGTTGATVVNGPTVGSAATSLTFANLTSPANAATLAVGDNWQLTITGAAGLNVYGSASQNAGALSTTNYGTIPASGSLVISGQMVTADIGAWAETWSVGASQSSATAIGNLNFTVQASRAAATSSTLSFITGQATPTATVGVAYVGQFSAVGGSGTGYKFSGSGNFPPGLTINANGTITGTPVTAGTYSFTVVVTDSAGNTVSLPWSMLVASTVAGSSGGSTGGSAVVGSTAAPTISLATINQQAGTIVITGSGFAANATSDIVHMTNSAGQVMGVSILSANNSQITVLYGALSAGQYTIQVANGANPTLFSNALSVTVPAASSAAQTSGTTGTAASPVITTTSIPAATVGTAYSQQLNILSGTGTGAITFALATGSTLPVGLTLSPSGLISGTPTTAGSSSFSVVATDSLGNFTSVQFSLTVNPAAASGGASAVAPPVLTTTSLPNGTAGQAYPTTNLQASSSSNTALTFSYTGNLPPGLTLSQNGSLSGTPTTAGSYTFYAGVTDGNGLVSSSVPLTITINAAASSGNSGTSNTGSTGSTSTGSGTGTSYGYSYGTSYYPYFLTTSLPQANLGQGYNSNILVGGASSTSFSLISGSLPPGLYFNTSTGQISGTPTTAGTYNFIVQVTNQLNISSSCQFSIQVNATGGVSVLGAAVTQPFTGLQMPANFQGLQMEYPQQPSPQVQGASITSSASTTYTVKKGDTLSGIAKKLTGSVSNWRAILAANPRCLSIPGNTKTLKVGYELVIPQNLS